MFIKKVMNKKRKNPNIQEIDFKSSLALKNLD